MSNEIIKTTDVLIVGGGPAGLSAAVSASLLGAEVTIIDENEVLGGQLIKQTHKFFGSEKEYAGTRGIDIAKILLEEIKKKQDKVDIITNSSVLGYYIEDGVVTYESNNNFCKIKPKKIIVATGASEKMIPFPNNDLPGIYGAGGIQTLMNVYGIVPGENVLMVGAGNIGLIVAYQLMQVGVNVQCVVEAMPKIGGYLVHASKIKRAGVPIYTSYTIKEAYGKDRVEGAIIQQLDGKFNPIKGTEKDIKIDTVCLAVGLSPSSEFLWQAGCKMKYIPELGGHVALRDKYLRTSIKDILIAGDVAGIEEASSAMIEGKIAGYVAASDIGFNRNKSNELINDAVNELELLRKGPVGEKIRKGMQKAIFAEGG